MPHRDARLTTRLCRIAVVTLATACAGATAAAADMPRGGGLVPSPRKTREELVREWDLNADGTIDQGEMEVASSRMRLERATLRLNSGIDPLTGLPRGEEVPEPTDDEAGGKAGADEMADEMNEELADEEPAENLDADREAAPALPGTRVPRPRLPGTDRAAAEPRSAAARATAGGRAVNDPRRQPLTGGVRAGGMPARAGYGAGLPTAPLNAGLPIVPQVRGGTVPPMQGRGGLVPGARGPARPPTPTPRPPSPGPTGPGQVYDPY